MRLVCPSCAAEYEVMAAAIGAKGRDVRCANCAHEWFQPPEAPAETPEEPTPLPSKQIVTPKPEGAPPPKSEEPIPEPVAVRAQPSPKPAAPEPTAEAASAPQEPSSAGFAALGAFAADAEPPVATPEPKTAAAQAEEAVSGDEAGETPVERLARISMPAFDEKPGEAVIDAPPQAPIYFDEDPIDQRSSVIEGASAEAGDATQPEQLAASMRQLDNDAPSGRGGGAFLAGFATVTLLSLIAIAVYVKGPDIAAAAPALESPLTAYAAFVDSGRMALAAATGG